MPSMWISMKCQVRGEDLHYRHTARTCGQESFLPHSINIYQCQIMVSTKYSESQNIVAPLLLNFLDSDWLVGWSGHVTITKDWLRFGWIRTSLSRARGLY